MSRSFAFNLAVRRACCREFRKIQLYLQVILMTVFLRVTSFSYILIKFKMLQTNTNEEEAIDRDLEEPPSHSISLHQFESLGF